MKHLKSLLPILSVSMIVIVSSCNRSNETKDKNKLASVDEIPGAWQISNGLSQYRISKNSDFVHGGQNACLIESTAASDTFNGIVQSITASKYLGKRILLSAYIKSDNIKGRGAIWMRADSDSGIVSFDNMSLGKLDKSVKGTTDWKRYDIVLDIPVNAQDIHIGAFLSGSGKMWLDDLSLTIVDPQKFETTGVLYDQAIAISEAVNSGITNTLSDFRDKMKEQVEYEKNRSNRDPMNLGFEE